MNRSNSISIRIDASRNRSGGAKAHLIGVLSNCTPEQFGICEIHVWAYGSLLAQLPDRPWLIKHNPIALERSLFKQLFWQATALAGEVRVKWTLKTGQQFKWDTVTRNGVMS
jgi:hypothetical protein